VPALLLYEMLWPARQASFGLLHGLGKFAFSYPLTLLLAFLSFRYLEKPVLLLRKRFA
jgi:peptidoglycan/LPS O-acetylase OafA/YrhL